MILTPSFAEACKAAIYALAATARNAATGRPDPQSGTNQESMRLDPVARRLRSPPQLHLRCVPLLKAMSTRTEPPIAGLRPTRTSWPEDGVLEMRDGGRNGVCRREQDVTWESPFLWSPASCSNGIQWSEVLSRDRWVFGTRDSASGVFLPH